MAGKATPTLIQQIAKDYLTPADAASSVLSDPNILYVVGTWPLTASENDKDLRKDLLMRIAKGSPYWYFCHDSLDLQEVATMDPPWEYRNYKASYPGHEQPCGQDVRIAVEYSSGWLEACAMRFCYLELVMKRYYQGAPHGIPIERLRFSQFKKGSPATLISAEPRIIPTDNGAALGLKTQTWFVYRSCPGETSSYSVAWMDTHHVVICDHIRPDEDDWIELIVHQESIRGGRMIDLCCSICETVFQLDVRSCGENTKALVLTKWMELGAGLDINDPKWQRHVNRDWGRIERPGSASGRGYWYHTPGALILASADTTRRWYEGTLNTDDYTGIDPMTKRNKECLANREYLDAEKGWELTHREQVYTMRGLVWGNHRYELREKC